VTLEEEDTTCRRVLLSRPRIHRIRGTYPLPGAADRSFSRSAWTIPAADELEVLKPGSPASSFETGKAGVEPCSARESSRVASKWRRGRERRSRYIVELASATRTHPRSPRRQHESGVLLMFAARALAAFEGSEFVTPTSQGLLAPAFRHRLVLRPEAEVGGQTPDRSSRRS